MPAAAGCQKVLLSIAAGLRRTRLWACACLLAWLAPALPAAALQPDKAFGDYVGDTWGVEHGLPQISVLAITQDRDGYLWFGSQGGLARYDGARFIRYGQDDAPELGGHVLALHGTGDGRVWIGTSQGLLVYRNGRLRSVPLLDGGRRPQAGFAVRSIVDGPGGGVLVAGPGGVYASTGAALELRHPLQDPALELLRDGDGVWAGSVGQVFRLEGDSMRAYPLPAEAAQVHVSRLARDRDGTLWAGTTTGLYRHVGGSWQRVVRMAVEALAGDRDGNLWAASPQQLQRLRDGRVVESIGDVTGARAIRAIHEDRDGNLWMGSMVDGATRLWNGWTARLDHEEGLHHPLLWSIARGPSGEVWVGGSDGVEVFDGRRFHARVSGARLPHPEAYSLLVERDRTWIGTRAGAAVLEGDHVSIPRALAPLRAVQVNGIVRDRAGRLWFATSQGLYLLWPDGSLSRYGTEQGLVDPRVRVVHETRDGRLLLGTHGGLFEWRDGRIEALGRLTGLDAEAAVSAIHELDDGRWIIGSYTGEDLRLFDGRRWTRLGRPQGIPANIAFFIASAGEHLWVAGMRGIYRVPLASLAAPLREPVGDLGAELVLNSGAREDGGQPGKCCNGAGNSRGLLLDGVLWLPTREGVVLVDTGFQPGNGEPARVLFERVQVGNEWVVPDPAQELELPLGVRDVKFEFTRPSFQPMHAVQLRYRLAGYEQEWRTLDAPHLRSATYTNLPPGHYRFEVVDVGDRGGAVATAQLALAVPPYWHEARSLRLLLPLLCGALAYLAYLGMQRRYRRQSRRLEQLVQERTRDLQVANARLEALSFTDPLTGLRNRRYLSRQIPGDLALHGRDTAPGGDEVVVFALLDLDYFKSINDAHGHAAGDRVLEQLGRLLTGMVRSGDYVARWGGEEFLLVLRPQPRGSLARIGERLCDEIRGHAFELDPGELYRLSVSIGLAEYPLFPEAPELLGWEQMVTLADRALYRAKSGGRDTWAACRPRPGAHLPPGLERLEGDPSWMLEQGLVEIWGPAVERNHDAPAGPDDAPAG